MKQIEKCTCPLCGLKIDPNNADTDLYFNVSLLVVNQFNTTYKNCKKKLGNDSDLIEKVLSSVSSHPMYPLKIRQNDLWKLGDNNKHEFYYKYTIRSFQIEIAQLLIKLVVDAVQRDTLNFKDDLFCNTVSKYYKDPNKQCEIGNNINEKKEDTSDFKKTHTFQKKVRDEDEDEDGLVYLNMNNEETNKSNNEWDIEYIREIREYKVLDDEEGKKAEKIINKAIAVGKAIVDILSHADLVLSSDKRKIDSAILSQIKEDWSPFQKLFNYRNVNYHLYDNDMEIVPSDYPGINVKDRMVGKIKAVLDEILFVSKRHCPRCSYIMAKFAGAYKEIVLTTYGFPRASKSTTIASCIRFLECGLGERFVQFDDDDEILSGDSSKSNQINLKNRTDVGEYREKGENETKVLTWSNYKKGYYEKYCAKKAVEETNTEAASIPRFSVLIDPPGQGERRVLTIIDIPGEYVRGGEDRIETWRKANSVYEEIYKATDYLWYCTDMTETERDTHMSPDDQIKLHGLVGKDDSVSTSEIKLQLTNNNSLLKSMISVNQNIKAMIIIGKTDVVNELQSLKANLMGDMLFRSNHEQAEVDSEVSDQYESRNKLIGRTSNEIWVDEDKICKYMSSWRSYLFISSLKDFVIQFEKAFSYNVAFCAMSAYGSKPNPEKYITERNRDKYQKAFFHEKKIDANLTLEQFCRDYVKRGEVDETHDEKVFEGIMNQIIYPMDDDNVDPFMGGWPILWLMIAEGIVRLKCNVIPKKKNFTLFSNKPSYSLQQDQEFKTLLSVSNEKCNRNVIKCSEPRSDGKGGTRTNSNDGYYWREQHYGIPKKEGDPPYEIE